MTAAGLIGVMAKAGWTVATCESVTGGLIAAALTDVAGASEVVRGGLVTYATDLKSRLAGVDPGLIAAHGVVSGEVATAMAAGASEACGADWAVAVTGVAGPGAAEGCPAGTVWLAITGPGVSETALLRLAGDRADVRRQVVTAALDRLETLARAAVLHHDPGSRAVD